MYSKVPMALCAQREAYGEATEAGKILEGVHLFLGHRQRAPRVTYPRATSVFFLQPLGSQ